MRWLVLVSLDDGLHVLALLHGPERHDEDEEESQARFLEHSLGHGGPVSPGDPLSALTDGEDLTENEEGDHGHGLDRVVDVELIS